MINKKIYSLYCIFSNTLYTTEVITNKTLLNMMFLSNNSPEYKQFITKVVNRQVKVILPIFHIITGGIVLFIHNFICNVLIKHTGLFISKKNIEEYALFQRNKLITFLNAIKNNDTKIINDPEYKNIIKDIGLDYIIFNNKSGIFQENLYILQEWLHYNILSPYVKNESISIRYEKFFFNIGFLIYKVPKFIIDIFNTFLGSPYIKFFNTQTVENIINIFSNNNINTLYANNKEISDLIKSKDLLNNENYQKFLSTGVLLPFYELINKKNKTELYENSSITDKNDSWFMSDFEKKLNIQNLNSIYNHDIKYNNINFNEIQNIRNHMLYKQSLLERIQAKDSFLLSQIIPYGFQEFQQIVYYIFVDILDIVVLYFNTKISKKVTMFVEDIIIKSSENEKLIYGLNLLFKNFNNKEVLPYLLIEIKNGDIEHIIKNYIFYTLKYNADISYSLYEIFNPIEVTKVKLINDKKSKPHELTSFANQLLTENIQKLIKFIQIHFLKDADLQHFNWLNKLTIESVKNANAILNFMYNLGRTKVTCVLISGLELLCGTRHENKRYDHNSLCTSIFLTYINNNVFNNKFLLSFTKNLNRIDEAVLDRFTIISSFDAVFQLDVYIILIKRYLLELMKINKNILVLDKSSFEKFVCEIAYEFYIDNWSGTEIKLFFNKLMSDKILKAYNNQFNKENILKLMKEIKL